MKFLITVDIILRYIISIPLASSIQQEPLFLDAPIASHHQYHRWNLNFSSPAPHYFASAYGLLQQWPNTVFPNGHSIVPCEIPPLTKLYHGRTDAAAPPSPEWVAFDIEMAYGIMGGTRNSHMLTYQSTRSVKCVYFDGESASLFGSGQFDTQMLHVWGNLTGPARPDNVKFGPLWDEYARARGLCNWLRDERLGGTGWGYEGIVRMNSGFEMIWCNFTSPSLRLISHLNVTTPLLPPPDGDEEQTLHGHSDVDSEAPSYFPFTPSGIRTDTSIDPTNTPLPPKRGEWKRDPFIHSRLWHWFTSSVDHYGSSADGPSQGEVRVKPASCGFLSYYSPVFTNQARVRAKEEQELLNLTAEGYWTGSVKQDWRFDALKSLTRRRRLHTLKGVTINDAAFMKESSARVLRDLSQSSTNCSEIDWNIMTNEIVRTYSGALNVLLKSLEKHEWLPKNDRAALRDWVASIRQQTHALLLPFLEYPDQSGDEASWRRDSSLFNETNARCKFQYTRLLDPQEGATLGPEEWSLKWAVEETLSGICSVLVEVGLSVEGLWQAQFNTKAAATRDVPILNSMDWQFIRWTQGVEELMAWLGWAGEWTRCEQKCAIDEKCYIPMWPFIDVRFANSRRIPAYGDGPWYGQPDHSPPNSRSLDLSSNNTGHGRSWQQDETTLWNPICVNASNMPLLNRLRAM